MPKVTPTAAQLQHRVAIGPLVLVMWLVSLAAIAGKYLVLGFDEALADGISPDDAMRLVEVRDFLAGQGWFDLTQYRLEPPEGVFMHWSRLVDLPLAALIRVGGVFWSPADAERFAMSVWPLLLLAMAFAGMAQLARRLAGDRGAVLALGLMPLTPLLLGYFWPGAIGHHNVQNTLLVWLLALLASADARLTTEDGKIAAPVRAPSSVARSLTAGLLAAASVAVGIEMLPAIAVVGLGVAALWIVRGKAAAAWAATFGLALATGTAALFVATVAPARYGIASCLAISVVHVAAAAIGGFGLAAAALLIRTPSVLHRSLGALGIGAALALTIGIFFPDCLVDPEVWIDPLDKSQWLARVAETQSFLSIARLDPRIVVSDYGFVAVALGLSMNVIWKQRNEPQWPWLLSTGVAGALFGVSLWEGRALGGATVIAVPLLAASLVRLFNTGTPLLAGLTVRALAAATVLNQVSLSLAGIALAQGIELIGVPVPRLSISGSGSCNRIADFLPFAGFPQGLVLAAIDQGPYLLAATPHSIVAAPYIRHASSDGMRIAIEIFLASPEMAKELLMARGVDYVALCPTAPETRTFAANSPQSLAANLIRGEVPDFLVPMPRSESPVIFFRVAP